MSSKDAKPKLVKQQAKKIVERDAIVFNESMAYDTRIVMTQAAPPPKKEKTSQSQESKNSSD